MSSTGCVIPIPADIDVPDAPVKNSDPVIVDSTPAMPGPYQITTTQTYTVTLRDADIDDTLYLRVFRNYALGNYGPIYGIKVQNDPDLGNETRAPVELSTQAWCQPFTIFGGTQLIIDVMVADRAYDEDVNATPQYRHIKDPYGKANIRSWVVTCPIGP